MKNKYNTTQLNPDECFKRHVYHRDQFAHYLRWTHVLNIAKINQNILDFGCGSGNLLEVFYRNKFKCKKYIGLDIRKKIIEQNKNKFKNVQWAHFYNIDLCSNLLNLKNKFSKINFDIICCFEVIEHIGKENIHTFLKNILLFMNSKTIFLISTPVFDAKVGPANNHIINGEIGELTFNEMKNNLSLFFNIKNVWGTFASQKDYKNYLDENTKIMFEKLKKYYDSNLLSNIMAPLYPEYSRNCIWECNLKNE